MRTLRDLLGRRRPEPARAARLRWALLRHGDTIVLTNRGADAVSDLRLEVAAGAGDGGTALPSPAQLAPGAAARALSPLGADTLWLQVRWTDRRHGPSTTSLRTDVHPPQRER